MIRVAFFLGIVAEMFSFYIAVYRKGLRRDFRRREWGFFLAAGCCALLMGCLPLSGILPAEMAGYAAGFFLVAGLFERSMTETLKYYSVAFFGVSMLNTMMISVAEQYFQENTDEVQLVGVLLVLAAVWSYFGLIGRRYDSTPFSFTWHIWGLMLAIMITEMFMTSFSLFLIREIEKTGFQTFGIIVINLGGIVIFSLYFVMLYQMNIVREMRTRYQLMEAYNEQQKNYFHLLLEKEKETQRMRHDYQAELALLRNYLDRGEYDKMERYLGEMEDSLERVRNMGYDVGSEIVNVILNHYLGERRGGAIETKISGRMADELPISQRDLCVIVSNLVRNAVEALENQADGKGWFEFQVSQSQRELRIQASNSCKAGEERSSTQGSIQSDKGGAHHGFGMSNIQDAVERNRGQFVWRMQDGVFEAKVIIPLS